MNREALVEKVWRSITAHSLDPWAAAEDALDAILPQVSTVTELEALPIGSVVVDRLGAAWEAQVGEGYEDSALVWNSCGTLREATEVMACEALDYTLPEVVYPVTVVWQPEVTA